MSSKVVSSESDELISGAYNLFTKGWVFLLLRCAVAGCATSSSSISSNGGKGSGLSVSCLLTYTNTGSAPSSILSNGGSALSGTGFLGTEELGIAERPAGVVGYIFLGLEEPRGETAFGGTGRAFFRGIL
jgi:hypothetical protein